MGSVESHSKSPVCCNVASPGWWYAPLLPGAPGWLKTSYYWPPGLHLETGTQSSASLTQELPGTPVPASTPPLANLTTSPHAHIYLWAPLYNTIDHPLSHFWVSILNLILDLHIPCKSNISRTESSTNCSFITLDIWYPQTVNIHKNSYYLRRRRRKQV